MAEDILSRHFQENTWGAFFFGGLLSLGLVCLISLLIRFFWSASANRQGRVEAWTIRWSDFGLLIWLLLLWIVLISGLIDFLLGRSSREDFSEDSWVSILQGILVQAGMVGVFCLYRFYQPQLFTSKINPQKLPLWKALSLSMYLFLAALPVVWYSAIGWEALIITLNQWGLNLSQNPQPLVEIFSQEDSPLAWGALIFLATITAPVVEELIFRGAIYRFLKDRMSPSMAALGSATLFALMHFNLLSFFPLIVLGIFLCISYELSGHLAVPILFHAFFNANSILLITVITIP